MTKIVLTEAQYNKLLTYITETRFDKVIKSSIQVGDIVRITYKNITNNFKVIQNNNGQVIMDNIDSGSTLINYRYFISFTGLHGTDLDIRRVNKVKEKDKLKDINTWKTLTVHEVNNIEVLRGNDVVDTVDKPISIEKKNQPKQSNQKQSKKHESSEDIYLLENIKDELLSLQEYHMVTFDLIDGTKILFCAVSKNGMAYELEVARIDGDKAKYDILRKNRVQMFFNESMGQDLLDEILIKGDGDKVSLLLWVFEGEQKSRFYIDFNNVKVGGTCEEEGKIDDKEGNKGGNKGGNKEELAAAEKTRQAVLNDPNLQKAFYTQPSLWKLFMADLKGKKAEGKGIVYVKDIVRGYKSKKVAERLSTDLKSDKLIKVKLIDEPIKKGANLSINTNDNIVGRVKPYRTDEGYRIISVTKNTPTAYEILIMDSTKEDDVFLCSIKFNNGVKDEILDNYENYYKFKFLQSDGYITGTK